MPLFTLFKTLQSYKAITFSYRDVPIELLGKLVIHDDLLKKLSSGLKYILQSDELVYLSTCNRVLLLTSTKHDITKNKIEEVLKLLCSDLKYEEIFLLIERVKIFTGKKVVEHCMYVASSMDSMVVGEKEILGQFKKAFEFALKNQICGEQLKLLCNKVFLTSKAIFNQTNIAVNPVSVVSLAYRKWKKYSSVNKDGIVIIGAGKTIQNFCNYLKINDNNKYYFFNRNIDKAKSLAQKYNGTAYTLEGLSTFREPFDTLISCTGSNEEIITSKIFSLITQHSKKKRTIIDLAVPQDVSSNVADLGYVTYIDVISLQDLANNNLKEREKELPKAVKIIHEKLAEFTNDWHERQVEILMSSIPEEVKKVNNKAIHQVFQKDLQKLDQESVETINKIVQYLEKKYIAIPLKLAKKLIAEKSLEVNK